MEDFVLGSWWARTASCPGRSQRAQPLFEELTPWIICGQAGESGFELLRIRDQ